MEAVTDPKYWAARLAKCGGDLHRSMFEASYDEMSAVEGELRKQIARTVHPHDSVLDIGCGYGRVLTLMPSWWDGTYTGIDICPEFISIAKMLHPKHQFFVYDATNLFYDRYDIVYACAIKQMLIDNGQQDKWTTIEANAWKASNKVVVLQARGFV